MRASAPAAMSICRSLALKDIRSLLRAPGQSLGVLAFVLMTVVLASLAMRQLGIPQATVGRVASGVFWLLNAFTAVLALQHIARVDEENGGSLGIFLSGVDMTLVFTAKWCVAWIVLFLLFTWSLLFSTLFFNLPLDVPRLCQLLELIVLVSGGISGLGVILSGIAVTLPSRDLVLPVLLFPLLIPIFAAAIILTTDIVDMSLLNRGEFWYVLLWGYLGILFASGMMLYEQIIR